MLRSFMSLIALATMLCGVPLRAENWSNWRGPNYDGSSPESGLPAAVNLDRNLAWKSPMLGRSGATPVIWGDKIFITSADDATKDLYAACYAFSDGKLLWKTPLSSGDFSPRNGRNNMAAPSPATDGKSVFFLYGNGELACLDMNGKIVWQKNLVKEHGAFTILWGYGSSPLLYKDKLYLTVLRRNDKGSDGAPLNSFLLALNPKDGSQIWKHVRENDAIGESLETYATPMPVEIDGKTQLIITCGAYMTAHDADTGAEIWRFGSYLPSKAADRRMVVSAVAGDGYAFCTAAKHASPFYAVKFGQTGSIPTSKAAWVYEENNPDCSTPLFYKDAVYAFDGDKSRMLTKLDPKTGAKIWSGKLPDGPVFRASPTAGDGKLYLLRSNGEIFVLDAGANFKILSSLALNEGDDHGAGSFSSIAISQGHIFVRTPKNLYCFKP